jgi:3-deoxy-D-manno-octulosonate cytidylyltransferase
VAVIPARLDSKRLPGKVLKEVANKPLIEWVYERAKCARRVAQVYITTDSPEVEQACRRFTSNIHRSRATHPCGTDRVAEAAHTLDADVIVNIQSDEPMMDPHLIDALAALFENPTVHMASAMTLIHRLEDLLNPNVVKAVIDKWGDALYFSRAPIPWSRDEPPAVAGPLPKSIPAYKHIGIYVYRRECLLSLAALPRALLEKIESLEQLRALNQGLKIRMLEWNYSGVSVETQDDLEKLRRML